VKRNVYLCGDVLYALVRVQFGGSELWVAVDIEHARAEAFPSLLEAVRVFYPEALSAHYDSARDVIIVTLPDNEVLELSHLA